MVDINNEIFKINETGFLNIKIDPDLDLFKEIEILKKDSKIYPLQFLCSRTPA